MTVIPTAPCELCGADPGQPCRPGCDAAEDWQARALAAEADLDQLASVADVLRKRTEQRDRAIARLAAVRALHQPDEYNRGHVRCLTCFDQDHPCDTARAAGVSDA